MRRQRRRTGSEDIGLTQSERLPHLRQHELVRNRKLDEIEGIGHLLPELSRRHPCSHAQRPLGEDLLGTFATGDLGHHAFHHLLPEARHTQKQRRLDLRKLDADILELGGERRHVST